MKVLLAAATAAALLAPLAASAQDGGGRQYYQRGGERPAARSQEAAPQGDATRDRGDRGARSGGRDRDAGAARQVPAPQAAPEAPRAAQAAPRFNGERQRGQRQAPAQSSSNFERRGQDARNDNRFRPDNRAQGANRNDNRFDNNRNGIGRNEWRSDRRFADNRNSFRSVRVAPFRWPSGYSSTRWSIRQRLPSIFLTRSYFISNFYGMGLPYPPAGAEWVRVGSDALLVDIFTGEILDVAYDAFYW